MIADREMSLENSIEAAPAGMVRVDLAGFFAFTEALWREARDEGRDYLTWPQWNAWGKAAIRARIVVMSDLTEDPEPPHVPQQIGMPYRPAMRREVAGARPDALFWRYAVIKTWRRIRESRDLGRSEREFHRDECVAADHEAAQLKKRDEERSMQRLQSASGKVSKHHGAAGESL